MRDRGESFDISGEEKSFSDRGMGESGDKKPPKFIDRRKIFMTEPEILKTKSILYSVIEDNDSQ